MDPKFYPHLPEIDQRNAEELLDVAAQIERTVKTHAGHVFRRSLWWLGSTMAAVGYWLVETSHVPRVKAQAAAAISMEEC